MPYAPGVQNISGQLLAQGIDQGLGALAQGLMENATRRRQKEEWAKASATLQPLIDKMAPDSGIKLDKDTPKEMVPQLISVAGQIAQVQREAPIRALQLENEKLRQRISQQELDTAAKNAEAAGAAAPFLDPNRVELPAPADVQSAIDSGRPVPMPVRGPSYTGAMSAYLNTRGTDPRMLAQLGDLAQQQMRAGVRTPTGLQSFGIDAYGRPVQGVVDAQGNVKVLEAPKDNQAKMSPLGKLVRERDAWRAQGRNDIAAEYDRVIAAYGLKVDAFGNPIEPTQKTAVQGGAPLEQVPPPKSQPAFKIVGIK